jgi:hypothetical protein
MHEERRQAMPKKALYYCRVIVDMGEERPGVEIDEDAVIQEICNELRQEVPQCLAPGDCRIEDVDEEAFEDVSVARYALNRDEDGWELHWV